MIFQYFFCEETTTKKKKKLILILPRHRGDVESNENITDPFALPYFHERPVVTVGQMNVFG